MRRAVDPKLGRLQSLAYFERGNKGRNALLHLFPLAFFPPCFLSRNVSLFFLWLAVKGGWGCVKFIN